MPALRPGARLGNYQLVRVIGSGGMGVVYEAHHEALGRRVAIKVLHALAPEEPKAAIAGARFLREGRAAAQVRHPHVVDVFDFGVHDGTPFLVMELVDGESLAERIEREGPLSLATALELLLPVLSAVGELHAAGIVHRDLKPANILIGRSPSGDDSPKVADFGVSRVDGDSPGLTESGVVVGSYPYMPPEQARACKTATEAADQYALGAILYECVTGKRPFEGDSPYDLIHAILHAPLIPPTERNALLPEELDAVLLCAMNRDPDFRFPCVEDFGAALLSFAAADVARRWASEFTLLSTRKEAMLRVASARVARRAPSRLLRRAAVGVSLLVGVGVVGFVTRGALGERPAQNHAAESTGPVTPLVMTLSAVATANVTDSESTGTDTETKPAAAPSILPPPPAFSAAAPAKATAVAPAKAKHPPARPVAEHGRDDGPTVDNGAPLLDPR